MKIYLLVSKDIRKTLSNMDIPQLELKDNGSDMLNMFAFSILKDINSDSTRQTNLNRVHPKMYREYATNSQL